MSWIRKERRVAIYLRDGMCCVYCGSSKKLTLDHVRPRSRGGQGWSHNLLTACYDCNTRRGDSSLRAFIATFPEKEQKGIVMRVRRRRSLIGPYLATARMRIESDARLALLVKETSLAELEGR